MTANASKRTYPQSEEDKVTANAAKRSYPQAEEDKVTANSAKRTYPQSEEDKVTANTSKISYTGATQVATNTSDLDLKLNTSGNQTMNGKLVLGTDGGNGVDQFNSNTDDLVILNWNDVGVSISAPQGKIGSLTFGDQNKSDRNQVRAYSTLRDSRNIGMHFFSNQADTEVPSLSVTDQLVGINTAQPAYSLDITGTMRVSGNVGFFGETPVSQQPEADGTTIGFTANSGTALNFSTTFTGGSGSEAYTVGDVVRCLKELGLLKT